MYVANPDRYKTMKYNRVGNSGVKVSQLSLGFWINFGEEKPFDHVKEIVLAAFDNGITHFDLANNYGMPAGSAERNLGKILANELKPYRDELFISTKAGYGMWEGPYGDNGSRKYLMASLDQSLERLGLPYVDLFYHHRPDYETPLEETMKALADIVHQGKALYVGISNYPTERAIQAAELLESYGVKLLIHQPSMSLLNRWVQKENLDEEMSKRGIGLIPFSVLSQGLLTNKYLKEIPEDSRAADSKIVFLNEKNITPELREKLKRLDSLAKKRGQTIAEMAMAWMTIQKGVSTILTGVSKLSQLESNLRAIQNNVFTQDELEEIEIICNEELLRKEPKRK